MIICTKIVVYHKEIENVIKNGTLDVTSVNKTHHKGSVSYVDVIEKDYPGYLHGLYRYATKVVGTTTLANIAPLHG